MSDYFEKEFIESMNRIHFSTTQKEHLRQKLAQSVRKTKEREEHNTMKKQTFSKLAAIVTVCLLATGVTAFAASKIMFYEAGSRSSYPGTFPMRRQSRLLRHVKLPVLP